MARSAADDSFDYFGSEDSAFLRDLQNAKLPGDTPGGDTSGKRSSLNDNSEPSQSRDSTAYYSKKRRDISYEAPPCAQPSKRRRLSDTPPMSPPLRSHGPPPAKRRRNGINLSIFDDISDDLSFDDPSPPEPAPAQPPPQAQGPRNPLRDPDRNVGPASVFNNLEADGDDYLGEEIYGAAHFGEFGEYMRRKRAKLQIQNTELDEGTGRSHIFKGISIYVRQCLRCTGPYADALSID